MLRQRMLVERTPEFIQRTKTPASKAHYRGIVLDTPTNGWVWVDWGFGEARLALVRNLRLVAEATIQPAKA